MKDIAKGEDHSIVDVWNMGYDGSGVKVVVIDDGFDHTHEDLRYNYNATLSKDLNEKDADPYPRIPKDDPEFNACALPALFFNTSSSTVSFRSLSDMGQNVEAKLLRLKITKSAELALLTVLKLEVSSI